MSKDIGIIDLKLSNLHNVKLACDKLKMKSHFVDTEKEILNCKALILPGVGSFQGGNEKIKLLNIEDSIKESIYKKKPFLGICLGMQLLFTEGYENGKSYGLKIFPGQVKKLNFSETQNDKFSIPNVGWNKIKITKNKTKSLNNVKNNDFMYFVHSYFVKPLNQAIVSSTVKYGNQVFCSSLESNNVFAFQFHPEKSSIGGLQIFKNFKNII